MECPVCYEEYDHAPYCPQAMEIEDAEDEYARERELALKALKRANKASTRLGGTVAKNSNGEQPPTANASRWANTPGKEF